MFRGGNAFDSQGLAHSGIFHSFSTKTTVQYRIMSNICSSPIAVDEPLEYFSVETYNWPKPAPSSRVRIDEKERRRRHCVRQKRFLARKRQNFKQLRLDAARLELQTKLLAVALEVVALQKEHDCLVLQNLEATSTTPKPHEALPLDSAFANTAEISEVIQSLDVDGLLAEFGIPYL
jgi:hypothetical protein